MEGGGEQCGMSLGSTECAHPQGIRQCGDGRHIPARNVRIERSQILERGARQPLTQGLLAVLWQAGRGMWYDSELIFEGVTQLLSPIIGELRPGRTLKVSASDCTADVSHPLMCPYVSVAAASSSTHSCTASLMFAVVMPAAGGEGGGAGAAIVST